MSISFLHTMLFNWKMYLMVTILTIQIHCAVGQSRILSLDCSSLEERSGVTIIIFKENEECPPPRKISCKVKASIELRTLRMRGTQHPFRTEETFPVNTWKEREMEVIIDNSEVTMVPNNTAYRYLLPRALETVSGRGVVDVECRSFLGPMRTSSPVDSTTSPDTEGSSLSTGYIILIVLSVLVILGTVIALVIFLLRKYNFIDLQQIGKGRPRGLVVQKNNSKQKDASLKSDLGAAVYIDPAAPNDYDNKGEVVLDTEKSTSGEYSYPYMDIKSQQPAKHNKDKRQVSENQYRSVASNSVSKDPAVLTTGKLTSGEYSYPYMDVASVAKNQGNGKEVKVNRQTSDRPYEDVQGNPYSYAYSSNLKI